MFMGSKMMKFQNSTLWERWVVVCFGVIVLSKKRDFVRKMKKYGNF